MAVRAQKITKAKLVVGEGADEVRFFTSLLTHLGITDVQVMDYQGKQRLSGYVQTLLVRPDFRQVLSLAITRDADDNAAAAFGSVCSALQNARLVVPPGPAAIVAGNPRVGIFILPDNQSNGMLEHLCLNAAQADPATPCLDDYFHCVLRMAQRQPDPREAAKARVHAWLASHPQPDLRLGEAAEKGYWPWTSPAFQPLIQFLRAL
jgi:hypothetical protein